MSSWGIKNTSSRDYDIVGYQNIDQLVDCVWRIYMKKENNYIIIRIRILILIKGRVRIASTNITENFVKILLREGFIENVRKP